MIRRMKSQIQEVSVAFLDLRSLARVGLHCVLLSQVCGDMADVRLAFYD
jgi:hypothetical protein